MLGTTGHAPLSESTAAVTWLQTETGAPINHADSVLPGCFGFPSQSTQQQVQSRKSQMIRGSSHGAAPRPSSARHRTSNLAREAGYGDTNSTVLMGSVAGDAPDGAAFSNQWHQQLMESDYDQVAPGRSPVALL